VCIVFFSVDIAAAHHPLYSPIYSIRPMTASSSSSNGTSRTLATVSPSQTVNYNATQQLESLPAGWEVKNTLGSAPTPAPYAVFTKPLETSSLDDRTYRIIRLDNGLEAMVIHDPDTDKSSAAMDIRVGHLSDPIEFQGLAHFCEHLLFMGTEKYPKENEYSEYLAKYSGSSNAYTGMDNTNYFFDVYHEHLEGALDRFAQFFLKPLFSDSCTEREVRAVDSEHKKNLQSDSWRAFQLEKSLCDPSHPYSHFGTGNAKTLWDVPREKGYNLRDELIKFHDKHYSANVMKLVVLGREPIETMSQWVIEKFSGVRNKGIPPPYFPSNPLQKEQLQTQVFFRSVKDIRVMDIAFPIPDQSPLFRSKPGQFLSHFIGHEGQGSILSFLKAKGWASSLSAGASNGAEGFDFFKVSVDLTSEGLRNYGKVVGAVFRYVDLLKASSIPEWTFEEVKKLCDLAFRFKEKGPPSSYSSTISTQMQQSYPREWVLSAPYLTREFEPNQIRELVDCLSATNCRVSIAAQSLPDGSKDWDQKETWYGTEYKLTPIPSQLLAKDGIHTSDEYDGMYLPKPNSFIPSSFEVEGKPSEGAVKPNSTERPVLAHHSPLSRLWHKKDDRFFLPKANLFVALKSPLIDATPSNAVKCRMLVDLIKDSLTEYSYDAELAGLGYNIEAHGNTIGVSVDGYNDKLPVLLRYVLEEFSKFKVDDVARFEVIKDQVQRAYMNFRQEAPYQHANYFATYLTVERMWTADEKLKELVLLTASDVQRFLEDIRQRLHIEMLSHGNIGREESHKLLEMTEGILQSKPLAKSELVSARSLILEPQTNYSYTINVPNDKNVNSSIEYYTQVGNPDDAKSRATLSLLSQMASEPCFDQLRTKEQLGYLVFSGVRKTIGSMGFRVIIQSERDSDYLESRIDEFYRVTFTNYLENMSEEEFTKQKESLIQKKLEKLKNLFDESSRYWYHIQFGTFNFRQKAEDAKVLRELTKKDIIDMFKQYISPDSPQGRSKLTVHLKSQVKPKRISQEALDAIIKESKGREWEHLIQGTAQQAKGVNVDTVKEGLKQLLPTDKATAGKTDEVLAMLDRLTDEHPFSEDTATLVRKNKNEKYVVIADAIEFKASLQPSRAAQRTASWEELSKEPEPESRRQSISDAPSSSIMASKM
jgi:insulysin